MAEPTFRPGDRVAEHGKHRGTIIGPAPRWRVRFDDGGEGTIDASALTPLPCSGCGSMIDSCIGSYVGVGRACCVGCDHNRVETGRADALIDEADDLRDEIDRLRGTLDVQCAARDTAQAWAAWFAAERDHIRHHFGEQWAREYAAAREAESDVKLLTDERDEALALVASGKAATAAAVAETAREIEARLRAQELHQMMPLYRDAEDDCYDRDEDGFTVDAEGRSVHHVVHETAAGDLVCACRGVIAEVCTHCRDVDGGHIEWPCPTRRALRGEA